MKPGFNPTGWIDDLRECARCGETAEWLRLSGRGTLKPIPKALQGPKGLHCDDCVEDWREVKAEAEAEEDEWDRRLACPAYQERLYREEQGCYED